MSMNDFLDLDELEREIQDARKQLARRVALVAVLALVTGAMALWGR